MPPHAEGRPRKVIEAIHDENKSALSAMGKKGAQVREEKKQAEKKEREWRNEEIYRQDLKSGVALNEEGDIVPPDDVILH